MSNMLSYKGYHATVEYDAEDEIFPHNNLMRPFVIALIPIYRSAQNREYHRIKSIKALSTSGLHQNCIEKPHWQLNRRESP